MYFFVGVETPTYYSCHAELCKMNRRYAVSLVNLYPSAQPLGDSASICWAGMPNLQGLFVGVETPTYLLARHSELASICQNFIFCANYVLAEWLRNLLSGIPAQHISAILKLQKNF